MMKFKYKLVHNDSIEIIKYMGHDQNVIIPHMIDGYKVISIGSQAFANNKDMIILEISEGIQTIGFNAFACCDHLTNVHLPESLLKIEGSAFSRCRSLMHINIPGHIKSIENGTFYRCYGLKHIDMPDNLEKVEKGAFMECMNLSTLSFHKNHHIDKIVKNMVNTALSYIHVDKDNDHYMAIDGVLYNKDCSLLYYYPFSKRNSYFKIPKGVKIIDKDAFRYCKYIKHIEIPESVSTIKESAFSGCCHLKKINIPKCIEKIEPYTFVDCQYLSIDIPENVKDIHLITLENMNVDKNNPYYTSHNGILYNKDMSELILYPRYKKDQSFVVPNTVTQIHQYAFIRCEHLQSITMPHHVSIDQHAFINCHARRFKNGI